MSSFEREVAFAKMNHTGAPLDLIRASTCSNIVKEVKSGKSLDDAIKSMQDYNEGAKPDLMVKWSLTEADIDFATKHGVILAKATLGR